MALELPKLFFPAHDILKENQKTSEPNPNESPRFLLIQGRAGIGKTTFVEYAAREWAKNQLWPQFEHLFVLRLRDLRHAHFIKAYERGEQWGLSDWIYQLYFAGEMEQVDFKVLWQREIAPLLPEKILFILDGYDELPENHPCQKALDDLLHNTVHKIVTSRPYGVSTLPIKRRDLEVVGFADDNVEKYIDFYFGGDSKKTKQITQALRSNTTLWGNAHIPVTLNIMCGVLEQSPELEKILPVLDTLSGLYAQMELKLLERAWQKTDEKTYQQQCKHLPSSEKSQLLLKRYETHLRILSQIAFIAFNNEQLLISAEDINQALSAQSIAVTERSEWIEKLLQLGFLKSVVNTSSVQETTSYEFLHLTFQEYFAAQYLPNALIRNDKTVETHIAAIKLNPRYQLVLWFTAGLLKNQSQAFKRFIELLQNEPQDWLGHYELGLLIRCTDEAWELSQQMGILKPLQQKVQTRIKGWWEYTSQHKLNSSKLPVFIQMLRLSPHWLQAAKEADVFALLTYPGNEKSKENLLYFLANLKLCTPNVSKLLKQALKDSSSNIRTYSLTVIEKLGEAATPDIFAAVWDSAFEYRGVEQGYMAKASNVGARAVTPQVLQKLLRGLKNSNGMVQLDSAIAIGEIGAIAATPDILSALALGLQNKYSAVRTACVNAVGKLGSAAATSEILAALACNLENSKREVWEAAIGELSESVVTREILAAFFLPPTIEDFINGKRWTDVIISKLGSAAILSLLAKIASNFPDSDLNVRRAKAIKLLGPAAAIPDILAELGTRLEESLNLEECEVYHDAIRALGPAAASPIILEKLAKGMENSNFKVSTPCLETIAELGPAAATPSILEKLEALWGKLDPMSPNFVLYLNVVVSLGPVAATPSILSAIVKARQNSKTKSFPSMCLERLQTLGSVAATPEIMALLETTLQQPELSDSTKIACLTTMQILRPNIVTPAMWEAFATGLSNTDGSTVRKYAEILGKLNLSTAPLDILMLVLNKSLLPTVAFSYSYDIRKICIEMIRSLGRAAATPAILNLLINKLNSQDLDLITFCQRAISALDPLFVVSQSNGFSQLIAGLRGFVPGCIYTIGKFGNEVAGNKDILILLFTGLNNPNIYVHHMCLVAISNVVASTSPDILTAWNPDSESLSVLTQSLNICDSFALSPSMTKLSEHNLMQLLIVIVGSYFAGNVNAALIWNKAQAHYQFQGYAGKSFFSHKLSLIQAQWLRHFLPQLMKYLEKAKIDHLTLAQIEKGQKEGMGSLFKAPKLPAPEKDPLLPEYQQYLNEAPKDSSSLRLSPSPSPSLIKKMN